MSKGMNGRTRPWLRERKRSLLSWVWCRILEGTLSHCRPYTKQAKSIIINQSATTRRFDHLLHFHALNNICSFLSKGDNSITRPFSWPNYIFVALSTHLKFAKKALQCATTGHIDKVALSRCRSFLIMAHMCSKRAEWNELDMLSKHVGVWKRKRQ